MNTSEEKISLTSQQHLRHNMFDLIKLRSYNSDTDENEEAELGLETPEKVSLSSHFLFIF